MRAESARYRTRAKELEDKLKAQEQAKLTDDEKAKARLTELETFHATASQQLKDTGLRLAVERQARRLGIVDEEAAFALMDRASVVYGDDGAVDKATVETALKTLIEARPWLKGAPGAPAIASTNPARPQTAKLTRDAIARMSPDEVNARWPEVQEVLRS